MAQASLQGAPFFGLIGCSVRAAEDPKSFGLVDGGLDPQAPPELIVHFQGVMFHPVLDSNAFGSSFQIGYHLAFELGMDLSTQRDLMAQESQDIGAAKAQQGMLDQTRIERRQTIRLPEHHVSGIFALATSPIILP